MGSREIEVSVVLPCLNEEATLTSCIRAAKNVLDEQHLRAEIIVADNGSTDRSREIAVEEGARVIEARHLGYGNALRTGLASAAGKYVVFLDADMSYDFRDIPRFVEELRGGADLVIGSRFSGEIDPHAMPYLHRAFGTPAMTKLANLLFGCGITDINCGMRGLTKEAFERLELYSEGMEFASEMMIKAAQERLTVVEIPIAFHADQRTSAPHLRSFRDGWRHLQLMLHFCSHWVYLFPGLVLALGGIAVLVAAAPAASVRTALALWLACLFASVIGVQILLLGLIAQGRVKSAKYARVDRRIFRILSISIRIEKGLLLGFVVALAGLLLFAYAGLYGPELPTGDPSSGAGAGLPGALRTMFLGAILVINGLQVFFTSLFMGLFGIRVAEDPLQHLHDESG